MAGYIGGQNGGFGGFNPSSQNMGMAPQAQGMAPQNMGMAPQAQGMSPQNMGMAPAPLSSQGTSWGGLPTASAPWTTPAMQYGLTPWQTQQMPAYQQQQPVTPTPPAANPYLPAGTSANTGMDFSQPGGIPKDAAPPPAPAPAPAAPANLWSMNGQVFANEQLARQSAMSLLQDDNDQDGLNFWGGPRASRYQVNPIGFNQENF